MLPFTSPQINPITRVKRSAMGRLNPYLLIARQTQDEVNAITEPTDRSTEPMMIVNSIPIATKIGYVCCKQILIRFMGDKKLDDAREHTTNSTMNIMNTL